MAYSTQADLEAVWGAASIARWSSVDPHNPATANTTRITAAIAEADAEIDMRFQGSRYTVPLSGNAAIARKWSTRLAAHKLYTPRAQPIDDLSTDPDAARLNGGKKEVEREIMLAVMGAFRPGFAVQGTQPTAPFVSGV